MVQNQTQISHVRRGRPSGTSRMGHVVPSGTSRTGRPIWDIICPILLLPLRTHVNAWKHPTQTLLLQIAISHRTLLQLDFCDKSFYFSDGEIR